MHATYLDHRNNAVCYLETRRFSLLALYLVALAAAAMMPCRAFGIDTNWNVTSGNWSDAGSWDAGVPTGSDYPHFANGGTAIINSPGATFNVLYLGGNGTIQMPSGSLSGHEELVGFFSKGTFTQSGGTNTPYELNVGWNTKGNGSYLLSGTGALVVGDTVCIGWGNGLGSFTQTGGTHTTSRLDIGYYSTGTYTLSSGQLSVTDWEGVGKMFGSGTITQSGGTNTAGTLYLGEYDGGAGTYYLNAGTLVASKIAKGTGTAAFNFNGGTLQAKTFNTGATLANSGTGTLTPGGGAIGSTAITGAYSQANTAALAIDIASPTSFDKVTATAASSLSGLVNVTLLAGYTPCAGFVFRRVYRRLKRRYAEQRRGGPRRARWQPFLTEHRGRQYAAADLRTRARGVRALGHGPARFAGLRVEKARVSPATACHAIALRLGEHDNCGWAAT